MDAVVTIEISGRNRYASGPVSVLTIRHARYSGESGEVMTIKGGYIEGRGEGGGFLIAAKHQTATDEEHDSAYVAYLEGAGLQWDHMMGNTIYFTGVILKGKFYTEEPTPEDECDADWCEEKHGYLDFTPPVQKWTPGLYEISIRFTGADDDE